MKVRLLILVVCAALFVFARGSFALDKEPEDFRGIKWGTEFKDLADAGLMGYFEKGDETSYTRKGDIRKFDDVDVTSVEYGFYKGKFYSVNMPYEKRETFEKLAKALEHRFGNAERTLVENFFEQYDWKGDILTIKLHYSFRMKSGRLTYFYNPVLKVKEDDEDAKRKAEKIQQEQERRQKRLEQMQKESGH